jgi:hypothetical protein
LNQPVYYFPGLPPQDGYFTGRAVLSVPPDLPLAYGLCAPGAGTGIYPGKCPDPGIMAFTDVYRQDTTNRKKDQFFLIFLSIAAFCWRTFGAMIFVITFWI